MKIQEVMKLQRKALGITAPGKSYEDFKEVREPAATQN